MGAYSGPSARSTHLWVLIGPSAYYYFCWAPASCGSLAKPWVLTKSLPARESAFLPFLGS